MGGSFFLRVILLNIFRHPCPVPEAVQDGISKKKAPKDVVFRGRFISVEPSNYFTWHSPQARGPLALSV